MPSIDRAMRSSVTKLCVACASTALSLAAAALYLGSRREETVTFVDNRGAAEEILLARQLEPRGLEPLAPGIDPTGVLAREPVDAETVKRIFVMGGLLEYDEHAYYTYPPYFSASLDLDEYPGRTIERKTNSTGEREDHETFTTPLDAFVLVAGDSHTDGVCTNPESYANVLERHLEAARPGSDVEVLNTGVAGYSFYNYLGVLEKYAARAPTVFVTGCYGGNDFLEMLRPSHYFRHTVQPPQSRSYWDELQKAKNISFAGLSQILNEILYFKRYPDEVEIALETTLQACAEIERQCKERGIEWIFLYIPSAFDRPWPDQADERERTRTALGLEEGEIDIVNRLADRLLAHLRARKVQVIDMREHFGIDEGPWFWQELHINLKANVRIAERLEPPVAAALAAKLSAGAQR